MGGKGVSHAACEWEPDGAELACGGPLAMPHKATTLRAPPTPGGTPARRAEGQGTGLSACTPASVCSCVSVYVGSGEGREAGRPEREALSPEERMGVWKGVKALREEDFGGNASLPSPGLWGFG